MLTRVITALVAGGATVTAVLLLDSLWVLWVVVAALEIAALEYARLGRAGGAGPGLLVLLVALPVLSVLWVLDGGSSPWAALAASPLIFALLGLLGRSDPKQSLVTLGWVSFGVAYLVLPAWSIYEIHSGGSEILLVLLLSVWANDAAALVVGSRFGRHKMAPRLSPNKTWEGSVAGLAAGVAVGIGGLLVAGRVDTVGWRLCALYVIVAAAAQAGDLVESLLKRAVDVKDSGALLPGHGGMLDRLDAILVAAPVFYALTWFFAPIPS